MFGVRFDVLAGVVGLIIIGYTCICLYGNQRVTIRTIIFLLVTLSIAIVFLAVGIAILTVDLVKDIISEGS